MFKRRPVKKVKIKETREQEREREREHTEIRKTGVGLGDQSFAILNKRQVGQSVFGFVAFLHREPRVDIETVLLNLKNPVRIEKNLFEKCYLGAILHTIKVFGLQLHTTVHHHHSEWRSQTTDGPVANSDGFRERGVGWE
jgi:hypothetical protein